MEQVTWGELRRIFSTKNRKAVRNQFLAIRDNFVNVPKLVKEEKSQWVSSKR